MYPPEPMSALALNFIAFSAAGDRPAHSVARGANRSRHPKLLLNTIAADCRA